MTPSGNQPPEKSIQEKLADGFFQLLVAGGGGYSLYNLYLDDIPKAFIAGGVSLGFSFFTSFGRPIIEKWKSGLEQLGKQVGDASTQDIGKKVELVTNRKFDQQYLEALKVQCDRIELEGFQNLQPLALDKVYVPLQIQTRDQLNLEGQKTIWNFLPKRYQIPRQSPHRRIAILAAPGYGKTTLMRHLTRTYAIEPPEDTPQFIPVLLRLREIYGQLQHMDGLEQITQPLSLSEMIVRHIPTQQGGKNLKPSKHWFEQVLEDGKCLILFDGLDEVPKAKLYEVRRWVDAQMKDYGNVQFILTSRPHGFDLRPDEPSYPIEVDTRLEVLKFNNPQKETFILNWYRALYEREWGSNQKEREQRLDPVQVRAHIEDEVEKSAADLTKQLFADIQLTTIASNPLLLTLIANTHRADTFLPKRRADLYERICNLFLGTRPYVKGITLSLTATENKALLQVLAWEMIQKETTQFTLLEAKSWIEEKLDRYTHEQSVAPNHFLEEMHHIAGLLVEKETGLYEFIHQTFQEYLAACHIKELGEAGEKILLDNLTYDRWREVIYFYAAQRDATFLIDRILNVYFKEPSLDLLDLANQCRVRGRELDKTTCQKLDGILLANSPVINQNISSTSNNPDSSIQRSLHALISLKQKTQQTFELSKNIAVRTTLISWREYRLFLEDVANDQFYAPIDLAGHIQSVEHDTTELPIRWNEARWFCGWLSTQTEIAPDEGAYHYRLPTENEWKKISENASFIFPLVRDTEDNIQPFTQPFEMLGNSICIVREQVPARYKNLINYLANARWEEADKETGQIMLKVANTEEQEYLNLNSIKTFPCEDLQLIDHLWLKFSNNHFGFSVQKEIYLSYGGKADYKYYFYEEAEHKFGVEVGWRENNIWNFKMRYNLTQSPKGHLPSVHRITQIYWWERRVVSSLVSRLANCCR